jgi:hypothetical protein
MASFSWNDWIDIVSFCCIIVCFILAGIQVFLHMRNFHEPVYQSKIIVILMMAPIYVLLSSLTIWTDDYEGYCLLVRDFYEAIVLYAFFKLLCAYVGYDTKLKRVSHRQICKLLATKGPTPHQWPLCYCLKKMDLTTLANARKIYRYVRVGILQYLPIRFLCEIIVFIIVYTIGESNYFYSAVSAIVFVSVSLALYWLIFFYHIFIPELKPYKALTKFLVIKGIVALTFWQEAVLSYFGVALSNSRFVPREDRNHASYILTALLVDIEMVLLAIMTAVAFSYKDFEKSKRFQAGVGTIVKHNLGEVMEELQQFALGKGKTFSDKSESLKSDKEKSTNEENKLKEIPTINGNAVTPDDPATQEVGPGVILHIREPSIMRDRLQNSQMVSFHPEDLAFEDGRENVDMAMKEHLASINSIHPHISSSHKPTPTR